jgi:hypothetical protein
VVACFVVPWQRIVVGTIDFTLIRLITLVGFARVIVRNEFNRLRWNRLDTAMLAFTFVQVFIVLLVDIPGAFTSRLGGALDSFGIYLLCRCLIRDWSDVFDTLRGFIWVGVIVAGFFVVEVATKKNVFGTFGYVPLDPVVRAGRIRAQAAFADPITAGVFWATLMPLMVAMAWRGRKARWEMVLGLIVSTTIIICCASSTPILGIVFGMIGACMFPLRRGMRWIRWGLLIGFCLFQLLSDKPAWRLLANIDIVGGSTGYYRYELVDQAVKHIDEWWQMGGKIDTTTWSPELIDDTNYFLVLGLQGGMPLLVVFLMVLALAFGAVGRMWRRAGTNRPDVIAAWALGVAIFIHIMSFFSVTYFGQIVMLWNLTLAMVGSMMPVKSIKRRAKKKTRNVRQDGLMPEHSRAAVPISFALGG